MAARHTITETCKTRILNHISSQLPKEWQYNKIMFSILPFSRKKNFFNGSNYGIQIDTIISRLKLGKPLILDILFSDPCFLKNLIYG